MTTITLTQEQEQFLSTEVKAEALKALDENTPFWAGVEWFLSWLRNKAADFFATHLGQLPVVGKWASKIGTTVSELIFTVFGTMINLLKSVFSTATVWKKAHTAAMVAWTTNENRGLLAQTYAYGKKMAGYFLEILLQCFERAIKAKGLEVTKSEKDEIADLLNGILN